MSYIYLPVYAVGGGGFEFHPPSAEEDSKKKGMILPFQPLTMTFLNVNYFVDMPKVYFFSFGFDFLDLLVYQIYWEFTFFYVKRSIFFFFEVLRK